MNDTNLLEHISALVDEEHQLRDEPGQTDDKQSRLRHLEAQLDQCWDLLRQRRAKREFGADPAEAALRDEATVKQYLG